MRLFLVAHHPRYSAGRSTRRLEVSPRRATPGGHNSPICHAAPRQARFSYLIEPSLPRSWRKDKTHLEHVFSAVALNLIRLDAYFNAIPLDRTRTSHLARLELALAA